MEKSAPVVSRLTPPSSYAAVEAIDTRYTLRGFLTPSCYDSLSLKPGAALDVCGSVLCGAGEE